jgi:hypothetical protein
MTIQDKIAAWPRLLAEDEYFGVGGILLDEETVHQIDALQARLDLALVMLRRLADAGSSLAGLPDWPEALDDARAVLAACGGEPE